MSNVRIALNGAGVRALLKSDAIADAVSEQARKIAERCGEGYAYDVYQTPGRVIASAYTEDFRAMRDNLKNNTLLKAMP